MSDRIARALAWAQSEMPTGKDQQVLANRCEEMRKEGESERAIVLALTGAVFDGLKWGNWPAE